MSIKEELDTLEAKAMEYFRTTHKMNHQVEFRGDELEGILNGYQGLNDVSAQVQRQYFLNGGDQK